MPSVTTNLIISEPAIKPGFIINIVPPLALVVLAVDIIFPNSSLWVTLWISYNFSDGEFHSLLSWVTGSKRVHPFGVFINHSTNQPDVDALDNIESKFTSVPSVK